MTRPTLREWLREEPYALGMSSGFFGFFAHAGVLSVLEEEELLPERVSGSSAGAMVTGLWGAGVTVDRLRSELMGLRRQHFWDPFPGPGLLRGRLFREKIDALLPVSRFEQTRLPVHISAFDIGLRRTVVLDSGSIAAAIHASCALPGLFHPVRHEGRWLSDGGILDRPGLMGLPPGRVLYHHLASKSPWRRRGSPALKLPTRPGLASLVLHGLPRVNPFRLDRGQRAYQVARDATRRGLDQPIEGGAVALDVSRDAA